VSSEADSSTANIFDSKKRVASELTSPEQVEKWTQLTKTVEEATKTKNIDLFDDAVELR
jgi:hypothetical protein